MMICTDFTDIPSKQVHTKKTRAFISLCSCCCCFSAARRAAFSSGVCQGWNPPTPAGSKGDGAREKDVVPTPTTTPATGFLL